MRRKRKGLQVSFRKRIIGKIRRKFNQMLLDWFTKRYGNDISYIFEKQDNAIFGINFEKLQKAGYIAVPIKPPSSKRGSGNSMRAILSLILFIQNGFPLQRSKKTIVYYVAVSGLFNRFQRVTSSLLPKMDIHIKWHTPTQLFAFSPDTGSEFDIRLITPSAMNRYFTEITKGFDGIVLFFDHWSAPQFNHFGNVLFNQRFNHYYREREFVDKT